MLVSAHCALHSMCDGLSHTVCIPSFVVVTSSVSWPSAVTVVDGISVAKRKACLRQKRHRAGSVSLFCAIVSSSD